MRPAHGFAWRDSVSAPSRQPLAVEDFKAAMKGLGLRRRRRPATSPFPEGWRSQAILGQLATRKLPPERGPRCRARARGAGLPGDGEEVAAPPAPQVVRSVGHSSAGVAFAGRAAGVPGWHAPPLSEAT